MIAQRSPGVQDSPSSAAARRRPDLRALSPEERYQRKRTWFSEDPNRWEYVQARKDVTKMYAPGPAQVFAAMLYEAGVRKPEHRWGPTAPICRTSYRTLAKLTGYSRDTVATNVAILTRPAWCSFCECAHPLARKLGQRYKRECNAYALLDDCAHVDPSERVSIENAGKTPKDIERFSQRDKSGRFTTDAPIAEQLTLDEAPVLAGSPARRLEGQAGKEAPVLAGLPARRLAFQASSSPPMSAVAALRALVGELPRSAATEIPEAVIDVLAEHAQMLLLQLVGRVVTQARAEHVPLTAEIARRVLDASPEIVSSPTRPMAPEVAETPAAPGDAPEVFEALVALAKGTSSTKQLEAVYTEELLPYALRERGGDRAAADRFLLDILGSRRVREHANPVALLRAGVGRKGEKPYLHELSDYYAGPRSDDARAKTFARLPAGEQAHILELLRAHWCAGGRFPQRELEEAGLGGKPMVEYLRTLIGVPIS